MAVEKDELKCLHKQVNQFALVDEIRALLVDAFKTKNSLPELEKHVREALVQSEDGKWACFVWFDGMRNGTYWQHQGVKFELQKEDETAFISISQLDINRDKVKNCSSKDDSCTGLRLAILPSI